MVIVINYWHFREYACLPCTHHARKKDMLSLGYFVGWKYVSFGMETDGGIEMHPKFRTRAFSHFQFNFFIFILFCCFILVFQFFFMWRNARAPKFTQSQTENVKLIIRLFMQFCILPYSTFFSIRVIHEEEQNGFFAASMYLYGWV